MAFVLLFAVSSGGGFRFGRWINFPTVFSSQNNFLWTLRYHFLQKFVFRYRSAPIFVEFVHYARGILVSYEIAALLAQVHNLLPRYLTISVGVADLERRGQVEEWVGFYSLSQLLRQHFNAEMSFPKLF